MHSRETRRSPVLEHFFRGQVDRLSLSALAAVEAGQAVAT